LKGITSYTAYISILLDFYSPKDIYVVSG